MDLGATKLFATLSDADLARVAGLAREKRFTAGETVVEERRRANAFYLVTAGQARVTIGGRLAAVRGPGEWFGEAALIDDARHATVTAGTDLGVLTWAGEALCQVLARNPAALQHVFDVVKKRAQELLGDEPG